MKIKEIDPHPQYLVDEKGNPQSVLIDYRTYREILEILEDFGCEEIIQQRLNEPDESFPENIDQI